MASVSEALRLALCKTTYIYAPYPRARASHVVNHTFCMSQLPRPNKADVAQKKESGIPQNAHEATSSSSFDPITAIAEETEMVQRAVFWLSNHPELTPFASIIGRYTTVRAMNACLGPSLSQHCRHCMEYLGVNLHEAGFSELCDCCMSLACRYSMAHPLESIRLAEEGIHYVTKAIHTLATLPDALSASKHKAFAKFLWQNQRHPEGAPCPIHALKAGMQIYNEPGQTWGDWLHVGLPEILSQLQNTNTIANEQQLEAFIAQQYQKWRTFGQKQLEALHLHVPDKKSSA
jgi:hypothetical protein